MEGGWGPALRAGAVYAALVFALGCLLGPLRVLVLTPVVGARAGHVVEAALVLGGVVAAAVAVDRCLRVARCIPPRLVVGAFGSIVWWGGELALALLLHAFAEFPPRRDVWTLGARLVPGLAFVAMPCLLMRYSSNEVTHEEL